MFQYIETTANTLDLPESVIEKDYYVTQVIQSLSTVENEYFRLVFCGGTCLAKAHKVVQRKSTTDGFSKSYLLKELKAFRLELQSNFAIPNLTASEPVVRNEGKYSRVEFFYPSEFTRNATLRPHILFEFTLSNIRCDVVTRSVKTLMEDTFPSLSLFPQSQTHCVAVHETAIEKWVGLTRRIIAIERGYHFDDQSLIRHVYDLNAIESVEPIPDDFLMLAKEVVLTDAQQFKNQNPEYAANPVDEINRSLDLLRTKPLWRERYQDFIENMVFNPSLATDYDKAINVIADLSKKVISYLH
ncbi:nucleotidyl transferase AbiEii/AbiGii toxin family protein [Legionella donaldsonii]|nr:nucleotidyl transferase AbiEii/AbiGii toxin family protein [Legionella donaldsonii]